MVDLRREGGRASPPIGSHKELFNLLKAGGLNTLIFDDVFVKLLVLSKLVKGIGRGGTIYADFEAGFTGLMKEFMDPRDANSLVLVRPWQGEFLEAMARLCSLHLRGLRLIILDSISSLYLFMAQDVDFGSLNQALALYLALLAKEVHYSNSYGVIATVVKPRRTAKEEWSLKPVGGRILNAFSQAIIYLTRQDESVMVSPLKKSQEIWGTLPAFEVPLASLVSGET